MHKSFRFPLLCVALLALLASACAQIPLIPGTMVPDTKINRDIIQVCEKYRRAMEDRDAETLLSLASPSYFEDSGTPTGEDDYGYEGLRQVINSRLAALKRLRYDVQYRKIEIVGRRANVDIRYDASYQVATQMGDRWERKQNDKQLQLEYDGTTWHFTAGM